MKKINIIIIALFVIAAMSSCKKSEIQPTPAPVKTDQVMILNYTLVIIPNMIHSQGDTLIIKLNGVEWLKKYQGNIASSYTLPVKTHDRIQITYKPGVVFWNNQYIVDENNLQLFLNNQQYYETKCRCVLNYDRVIQ